MYGNNCKPRRRKLYKGTRLEPSGIHTTGYFQDFDVGRAMVASVTWQGQVAQLHFWNFTKKSLVNDDASALIKHPGFCIRGPAIVVTGIETWFHWELPGDEQTVKEKFDHLVFKGQYHVLPSARWNDHQNFYNDNENDFVLIKLAI